MRKISAGRTISHTDRQIAFHRTGLVIWPNAFNEAVEKEQTFSEWALTQFDDVETARPTAFKRRLMEYLVKEAENGKIRAKDAAPRICAAGIAWRDAGLWNRGVATLKLTHNCSLFDPLEALSAFGFVEVAGM